VPKCRKAGQRGISSAHLKMIARFFVVQNQRRMGPSDTATGLRYDEIDFRMRSAECLYSNFGSRGGLVGWHRAHCNARTTVHFGSRLRARDRLGCDLSRY
jgi:hypothetical protein